MKSYEQINSSIHESHLLKRPRLDKRCLMGLSGSIVNSILPHSEADEVALLSQLLTGFGNLIGSSAHFIAEDDRHASNLFILNVGDSSKARKGVSWGRVSKLFIEIDSEWHSKKIRSGLSSGEGLIDAIKDSDPERQTIGVSDKRLLCMEGEFASVLKVASREGNTISANLRNAWDGKTLSVMTKNSPMFSTQPHVSIIGHITSFELRKLLNQTEISNGLGNRFLYFHVHRSKVLPEGSEQDPNDIKLIINELKASVAFAKSQGLIKRNEAARSYWSYIYPKISEGKLGLYGALTSRAEAQIMRLALILALLDRKSEIELEHLEAAHMIFNYSAESVRYIFGYQTGSTLADKIKEYLDESEEGRTRTEIRDKFSRNYEKESLDSALRLLKEADLAYCIFNPLTKGRPSEIWKSVLYSN